MVRVVEMQGFVEQKSVYAGRMLVCVEPRLVSDDAQHSECELLEECALALVCDALHSDYAQNWDFVQ